MNIFTYVLIIFSLMSGLETVRNEFLINNTLIYELGRLAAQFDEKVHCTSQAPDVKMLNKISFWKVKRAKKSNLPLCRDLQAFKPSEFI